MPETISTPGHDLGKKKRPRRNADSSLYQTFLIRQPLHRHQPRHFLRAVALDILITEFPEKEGVFGVLLLLRLLWLLFLWGQRVAEA
jgi:hypothetical protein